KTGKAYSFVVGKEIHKLKDIQRYAKTQVVRQDIPSLREVKKNRAFDVLEKVKCEIETYDLNKYKDTIELLAEEGYKIKDIAAALLKIHLNDDSSNKNNKIDNENKNENKRLFINIGRKQGVSPRHILGGIYDVTNIPGDSIGNIDIYDKFSFVEVPKKYSGEILNSLNNNK